MKSKLSKLIIGGVEIPAGADNEINCNLSPISVASDIRRTINGDAINVARSVMQKYAIGISGNDAHPAGLAALRPGDYVEVSPFAPVTISLRTPSVVATLPRAGFDVVGIDGSGARVQPFDQPASPFPLTSNKSNARVSGLRIKPVVQFEFPVVAVRYRILLACVVLNWSTDSSERTADGSWSIDLEEI